MKFFFADSLDCVDPNFDFLNDRFSPGRNRQSGDLFAHEVLGQSPYHGLLLSYAAVGAGDKTSRFSQGQRLRLFRDGLHSFYRYPYAEYSGKREDYPIMGDSGAFSFRNYDKLPFTLQELYDYYATCGFTHGVSLDTVISEKNPKWDDVRRLPAEIDARAKYTLKQAAAFLHLHREKKGKFTPIGVIQAWTPSPLPIMLENSWIWDMDTLDWAESLNAQVVRLSICSPRSVHIFQTISGSMYLDSLAFPTLVTFLALGSNPSTVLPPCSNPSRMINQIIFFPTVGVI